MEPDREHADEREALAARLFALDRRLRLLLAHRLSPALAARFEPDDLAQEVWLRLLARPGKIPPSEEGEGALWAWVRTVARNTVIDAARALRAARRDGVVERLDRTAYTRHPGVEPPAAGPGPATALVGAEAGERLLAAFRRLDPEHRRVIGLRRIEGLDARAAAARMGRSVSAVHSLYRRALAAWDREAEGR